MDDHKKTVTGAQEKGENRADIKVRLCEFQGSLTPAYQGCSEQDCPSARPPSAVTRRAILGLTPGPRAATAPDLGSPLLPVHVKLPLVLTGLAVGQLLI